MRKLLLIGLMMFGCSSIFASDDSENHKVFDYYFDALSGKLQEYDSDGRCAEMYTTEHSSAENKYNELLLFVHTMLLERAKYTDSHNIEMIDKYALKYENLYNYNCGNENQIKNASIRNSFANTTFTFAKVIIDKKHLILN
jgi:hypothetical protein